MKPINSGTDRKTLVRIACAVARTALRYVPEGEDRPRLAIEAAERWLVGDATIEQVSAAADAAANNAYEVHSHAYAFPTHHSHAYAADAAAAAGYVARAATPYRAAADAINAVIEANAYAAANTAAPNQIAYRVADDARHQCRAELYDIVAAMT